MSRTRKKSGPAMVSQIEQWPIYDYQPVERHDWSPRRSYVPVTAAGSARVRNGGPLPDLCFVAVCVCGRTMISVIKGLEKGRCGRC